MSDRKRRFDDDDRTSSSPNKKGKKSSAQPSFLPPKDDLKNLMAPRPQPNSLPSKPQQAHAQPSTSTSKPPPSTSTAGMSQADLIAQKRAEIQAKIAGWNLGGAGAAGAGATAGGTARPSAMPYSHRPATSSIPTRTAPVAAAAAPAPPPASSSVPGLDPDMARKIAEAKKKVEAMAKKTAVEKNIYLSSGQSSTPSTSTSAASALASAGVKGGIHPMLLQSSADGFEASANARNRYKPMQPKFSTVKANRAAPAPNKRLESSTASPSPLPEDNPYFDPSLGDETSAPKERRARALRFASKGKFIKRAEEMRQAAKFEEIKARIAASAAKAGLDIDQGEKAAKRPPPPEVEWWDEPLLPNKSYEDIDDGTASKSMFSDASPITIYVQHPIPIAAPGDKNKVDLKPLMLTKKEQKKLRRQRRLAENKDKTDRIRMGLQAPDPPKVKISNMMKVLTQEAVADPTKIEARVKREMLARKEGHEKMNAARQLTDEQRREKIEQKKEEDEKKGIYAAAFKIRYLVNPLHQSKVKLNAEQNNLTGITIYNPKFTLVFVEGPFKGIKKYIHLMMNRIDWTEESTSARARAGTEGPEGPAVGVGGGAGAGAEGEEEQPQSLVDNKCDLVWQGPLRDREFKSFRPKRCPTDNIAKETLGPKLEGYWDLAKKLNSDIVGI